MSTETRKDQKNIFESLFVAYLIFEPISQILRLLIGYRSLFIIPVIYLIIILSHLKLTQNKKAFIMTSAFFAFSFLYSVFSYRDYLYNYLGLLYLFFVTTLPWLLVGLSISNTERLLDRVERMSPIILGSCILLCYVSYLIKGEMVGNMGISYSVLPITVFSLYSFFKSKKIRSLLFFLIGAIIIIGFGSRGPLLCILSFIVMYLLLNIRSHKLLFGTAIILAVAVGIWHTTIIDKAATVLSSYGVSSRTLYKLKSGEIADGTGREEIYKTTIKLLNDNPIIGVGIGVERITIKEQLFNEEKDLSSSYPHNIFLELLVQYGYIIGGILCIAFVGVILFALTSNKASPNRDLIIVLAALEPIRLMVSSSYILSPMLFCLLGICITQLKRNHNEKVVANRA